jgi:hypothetical protein
LQWQDQGLSFSPFLFICLMLVCFAGLATLIGVPRNHLQDMAWAAEDAPVKEMPSVEPVLQDQGMARTTAEDPCTTPVQELLSTILTLDDFEQYDDNSKRIFFAWQDGMGHSGGTDVQDCDVMPSKGNGSGAIVGHDIKPFAEKKIVHAGKQSMPIEYNNAFGTSEATLTLEGQNWAAMGAEVLSFAFYGAADNAGRLFIRINDHKVVYDGDPRSIALAQWQTWAVDLASVMGDLTSVTKLTIGVEGDKVKGTLYIDDIRLLGSSASKPEEGDHKG